MGLLRIHVHRGVNLAKRDVRSSDPYVIIRMGKQVNLYIYIYIFFDISHFLGFLDFYFFYFFYFF